VALGEVSDDRLVGEDARMRGAIISSLTSPLSPAGVAGLQPDDLIVAVDGKPIRDMGHLMRIIGGSLSGSVINLSAVRDRMPMKFSVKLGSRPID
jgi:S1-C subfamily serine protease